MRRARLELSFAAIASSVLAMALAASCGTCDVRAASASATSAISAVTLTRDGCTAACPADDVTFRADGSVVYKGSAHVAKPGRNRGRITNATYVKILAAIARAKFFTLPSTFGAYPREAATYDIVVKRGAQTVRVSVNDSTVAPRPLRDLAGLLSKIRDGTTLESESPIDAVVGRYYGLPSPDREIVVGIGPTDDAVFTDHGYVIDLRERDARPCNADEPVSKDPLDAAVSVGPGGAIFGDGYTITRVAGNGIRLSNARESIDLQPVRYQTAPDLLLRAPADPTCPTTIVRIDDDGDVDSVRPRYVIVSNLELDVSSIASHAHFRCDANPARSIAVEPVANFTPDDGPHFEAGIVPASDLIPGRCRLTIDAGVAPKGPGMPASATESDSFTYEPRKP